MKKLLSIIILIGTYGLSIAQNYTVATVTELSPMIEPVANNAVAEGWANDTGYVYSFGGIDSTKLWSGIHLRSFRYNSVTDIWDTIPSLPDTLGKIAAGASWVDSIIYIIGGYHVYSNGNEASSDRVHRYDPRTNTYLSDGTPVPVPIDDHVQAVWNDSLIYVITGWSNTGNVGNVQIYDPANDQWVVGTPVPNNLYKVFGASGTIIGNTIYYHGGALYGFNYPGQNSLRIGQINPSNPTQITWSSINTGNITYRSACFNAFNIPHWFGGSGTTYNYNGIAYNGSGGVDPNIDNYVWNNNAFDTIQTAGPNMPMDLRGVASINYYEKYIAGGMASNQIVSSKTFKIEINATVGIKTAESKEYRIFPNPSNSKINLIFNNLREKNIQLIDLLGNIAYEHFSSNSVEQIDVSNYQNGIYFLKVNENGKSSTQKVIIQ